MQRVNFFFEQRVTQSELDEVFDDAEASIWDLMKEAIGFGFLSGAVVAQHSPTPDLSVDAGTFLGYDQLGRRLYLPVGLAPEVVNCALDEVGAATAVAAPGNEKTLALFVEFDRKLSDPRLDGNGVTVYYQVDEWFKVNVVQSAEAGVGTSVPPPLRNDQILIADVVLIYGQTQILNADIDQSRKEDFTFSAFLHGGSHRELGTDPVPNATAADGGIMSGADKTKLDGITWTPAAVGALLGYTGRAFNPANILAPSATSMVVTTEMAGKSPGGDATTKGIITGAPTNLVKVFDVNRDSFLDASGDKVYARITEAAGVWTLSFYVYDEGVGEAAFDMTPNAGATIIWYVQEVYSLDSFPVADPMFAVQSDQIAGEVPDATTTVKGKVELATDGETAADKVVQGNDSRLTGSGALTLVRKMASRPSLIFMPNDTSPFSKYRLHQLHGLARGDHQAGSPWQPADFYFEVDRSDADYPLEVYFVGTPNGDPQPGRADNTQPGHAANTWYYVYAIGRDSGSPRYALVFSDRAPWVGGPLLDDSTYKFWNAGVVNGLEGRWRYWRFVACCLNVPAGSWELLVLRKKGNHVEWELAQRVVTTGDHAAFFDASLAQRVPPTSMRAFLVLTAYASFGGDNTCILAVRPPVAGTMGLNEIPGVNMSQDFKLRVESYAVQAGWVEKNNNSGWVALNTARDVAYTKTGTAANRDAFIDVLGYEEFDDVANAELSFG